VRHQKMEYCIVHCPTTKTVRKGTGGCALFKRKGGDILRNTVLAKIV